MGYPSLFSLISSEFNREKIPFVLIGGFAVNFYNVSRLTKDVDFLIAKEDFRGAAALLKKAGYNVMDQQEVFARLQGEKFSLKDIDFMFVDKNTLDLIIKDGKKVEVAKGHFIVPSLLHLIALKLHSIKHNREREFKDLADIVELVKNNRIDVREKQFKEICLTHGTSELYEKRRSKIKVSNH